MVHYAFQGLSKYLLTFHSTDSGDTVGITGSVIMVKFILGSARCGLGDTSSLYLTLDGWCNFLYKVKVTFP